MLPIPTEIDRGERYAAKSRTALFWFPHAGIILFNISKIIKVHPYQIGANENGFQIKFGGFVYYCNVNFSGDMQKKNTLSLKGHWSVSADQQKFLTAKKFFFVMHQNYSYGNRFWYRLFKILKLMISPNKIISIPHDVSGCFTKGTLP